MALDGDDPFYATFSSKDLIIKGRKVDAGQSVKDTLAENGEDDDLILVQIAGDISADEDPVCEIAIPPFAMLLCSVRKREYAIAVTPIIHPLTVVYGSSTVDLVGVDMLPLSMAFPIFPLALVHCGRDTLQLTVSLPLVSDPVAFIAVAIGIHLLPMVYNCRLY